MTFRNSIMGLALLLAILTAAAAAAPCLARAPRLVPPFPSSLYGEVRLGEENVAPGTQVQAVIGGEVYAATLTQIYEGVSVYSLDVPGDDAQTPEIEGGVPGDTITFLVGGIPAAETIDWQSGTNRELNLSVAADQTLAGPLPSPTPIPTQTAIPVQTSPPPTTAPAAQPAAPAAENNPAAGPALLVGALGLAAVGGAFLLWKRKP